MEHKYKHYGFDPCKFEPDNCDRCKAIKPLFFGDRDFFDSREGNYLCGDCLDERIEADLATIAEMKCTRCGGKDIDCIACDGTGDVVSAATSEPKTKESK